MNGVQHNYPNSKKDESLRNFHWCLIRTLHNYPFPLTESLSQFSSQCISRKSTQEAGS